jgi:glutamyl-tRNA synthetase
MVRVRFAPSPTGYLHVGGARTALFNWLFARHHGGTFILRIEDTDQTRSTKEATQAIFDGMEWLGLDWDEGPGAGGDYGPYHQAERLAIYQKHAQTLVEKGFAYHQDGAIYFKTPKDGEVVIDDLVRGKVRFKNELFDDFVIVKSDGFPVYNFACVIDDATMKISHVIRGEDHLSNTPRQIHIYEALGFPLPVFAHIPMILAPDRSKLSKRHGAVSVIEYQKMGYLPEAAVNYLARLGWSHGDQEVFSRDELIKFFSLETVSKTGAIFDFEKLKWLNGLYIRASLPERIYDLCLPYLEAAFKTFKKLDQSRTGYDYILKVIKALQDRIVLIPEIVEHTQFFFDDHLEYEALGIEKYLQGEAKAQTLDIMKGLAGKIEALTVYDHTSLEGAFKALAAEKGLKLGQIIHPTRLALTGRKESPGIYLVCEILGKEKVLERLNAALKL